MKSEQPHHRVKGEALRLGRQPGHRGASASIGGRELDHSSTWLPARAGQLAAASARPRKTARVRTNELTVACNARKRSSTDARTYKPPVVQTCSSKVRVTSSPRQNPPVRAPGPRNPGTRAAPGRDVTLSRARMAARDSEVSRQS